ncbi:hypothetical protein GDO78_013759 [Eleutherodactylus coqui]|uniref:Uncharacterized protein n=1 Tax=Eleutherodactylus coqui TaxID=57060 RepID=A0A8J6E708_ELECQ|nr:hypothetical protein GDO78_013759 [Eleutherodactylus coqui]
MEHNLPLEAVSAFHVFSQTARLAMLDNAALLAASLMDSADVSARKPVADFSKGMHSSNASLGAFCLIWSSSSPNQRNIDLATEIAAILDSSV